MTDREIAAAGLGWIAGCLAATLACLAAIALETREQNRRVTCTRSRATL